MPANLTPAYHAAERGFQQATTIPEKIEALQQMLAVIPKHKGTDHMRADLRRRLSKLRQEAQQSGKGHSAREAMLHLTGALPLDVEHGLPRAVALPALLGHSAREAM